MAQSPQETETLGRVASEKAFVIRLPEELHAAVKQRAAIEERSMAQTVRRALRHYLEAEPAR